MKEYTEQNPVFSDTIQITEITDPAHADVINTPIKQLFGNTVANKENIEHTQKKVDKQLVDFKMQVSAEQTELNKALAKAIKDIADYKGESVTTFNPDGSIVTINSLETITTNINKSEKTITSKHDFKNGLVKTFKTVFESKVIRTTEVK